MKKLQLFEKLQPLSRKNLENFAINNIIMHPTKMLVEHLLARVINIWNLSHIETSASESTIIEKLIRIIQSNLTTKKYSSQLFLNRQKKKKLSSRNDTSINQIPQNTYSFRSLYKSLSSFLHRAYIKRNPSLPQGNPAAIRSTSIFVLPSAFA